jgi:hypothetical protein
MQIEHAFEMLERFDLICRLRGAVSRAASAEQPSLALRRSGESPPDEWRPLTRTLSSNRRRTVDAEAIALSTSPPPPATNRRRTVDATDSTADDLSLSLSLSSSSSASVKSAPGTRISVAKAISNYFRPNSSPRGSRKT